MCVANFLIGIGARISLLVVVVQGQSALGETKPRKLKAEEIAFDVPEVIQKDLHQKAVAFVLKVYPDADKETIVRQLGEWLVRDRYVLSGMGTITRGPYFRYPSNFFPTPNALNLAMTFPNGGWIELLTGKPPKGVEVPERRKPLEQKEAEAIARQVFVRIVDSASDASRFVLTDSGEMHSNWVRGNAYYFTWQENRREPLHTAGASVRVELNKADGLIERACLTPALPDPKIPPEEAARRAAQVIEDYLPKYLRLDRISHAGKPTLVWRYTGSRPAGGSYRQWTTWDASTWELLDSKVLNGGTERKSYMNPDFYVPITDELKKKNIEELVKNRVEELEKANRGTRD